MPTVPEYLATTTRAARLGYRVLIVAGSHVEMIDAASGGRTQGSPVQRVATWEGVEGWLDEAEQLQTRKKAA